MRAKFARMTLNAPIRASACPSLYRLAPGRDGSIARIRLPLGRLTPEAARAVAQAARRYGNGTIEITSRANLQVRGLAETDGAAFAEMLFAAGLGADPAAEDVLNVMVAPTHGRDRAALIDTTPLAKRLLNLLRGTPLYHALSPKFSIGIDGGEAAMPRAHPHDIWLRAMDAESYAIGLASSPLSNAVGAVPIAKAEVAIAALLDRVVAGGFSRMRDLMAQQQPDLAGFSPAPTLPDAGAGAMPLGVSGMMVGARPPLGRLTPDMLEALAKLDGEVRLTPWQSVLLVDAADPEAALKTFSELGFAVTLAAPLAQMIACSGSAGCRSGRADTLADALVLAEQLDQPMKIHLSGCDKSCAAAGTLPVTLVAVAPGRYDLYCEDLEAQNRFGRRIGAGLGLGEIAFRLAGGA
jgi:precorrin-3B synthase